jgi:hypothetical protein
MSSATTTTPPVAVDLPTTVQPPVPTTVRPAVQRSVAGLVVFLQTGGRSVPDGLFAPDLFADLTFPRWRVQVEGDEALVEARRRMHPQPGTVRLEKVVPTTDGWALMLEERWEDGGQQWYCREGFLAGLDEQGRIVDFTLYCTGDWDEARVAEHARAVTLLRP